MILMAVAIGIFALVLTSCGGNSLTSVQSSAVKGVEANVTALLPGAVFSGQQVVGATKNVSGNTVTVVYVEVSLNGKKTWGVIFVDTDPNGKLIWADLVEPSNVFTVTP
jgi:hypothetical protein